MQIITSGIVIKENNVGESDRVVTVLTRDRGLVNAFVTGARRPKNKKSTGTALLSYSEMVIYKGKDTYKINEATPIEIFFELRKDIVKLSLAQYFCELALSVVPYEYESDEFLRIILNSLFYLCKGNMDINLIKAITEMRIMVAAGFMPDLEGCAVCDSDNQQQNEIYFNVKLGQIFCHKHKPADGGYHLSGTVLDALRHIVYCEFNKLYSFSIPNESINTLSQISETFVQTHVERSFKTLAFFHSL